MYYFHEVKRSVLFVFFICSSLFLSACKRDNNFTSKSFKTENVIIILIDGARYSETWGDNTHQFIPGQELMSKEGVVFINFNNDGTTNTINGHTAITTGYYQNLDNSGMEKPARPSLFQLYLESKKGPATDAWIISSKDKLQVLGDCTDNDYEGQFIPQSDCGNNGLFTGYREDSITFLNATNILNNLHPHLVFISFKQPDSYAHAGDWNNYLNSLAQSDDYTLKIWQALQNDPHYKDKTAVFVTNDHGRHLDGVSGGFASHGDTCSGCRHIMLLAAGPDFKRNIVIDKHYGLTDINATVSWLFGLKNNGQGKIMYELFK